MTVKAPLIVQRNPAESAGVAGAMGLLIARGLGVTDADTIVALGVVIGFVPAGVTWLVNLFRKGPPQ